MKNLIARLAAGATLAASMGLPAMASADINLTGPDSRNVIDIRSLNRFTSNTSNWVTSTNWNRQSARSGDVTTRHNTTVWGGGGGSGDASNSNSADNSVSLTNSGQDWGSNWSGGGDHQASIDTTGPDSTNRITISDTNRVTSNIRNNVDSTNANFQTASSGDVRTTGNTEANGGAGSGNAFNENSATNDTTIDNQVASGTWSGGSGQDASISTTGPDSSNTVRLQSSNTVTQNVTNNVSSTNFNRQSATSGDVTVSGNTVADGGGGSGTAANFNTASNNTQISNN